MTVTSPEMSAPAAPEQETSLTLARVAEMVESGQKQDQNIDAGTLVMWLQNYCIDNHLTIGELPSGVAQYYRSASRAYYDSLTRDTYDRGKGSVKAEGVLKALRGTGTK